MRVSPFIFLLFFSCSACQALGRPAPGGDTPRPNPTRTPDPTHTSYPPVLVKIGPIKQSFALACSKSGGRFDSEQQLCDCPQGKSFSGWTEECLPIEIDHDSQSLSYAGYPQVTSSLWLSGASTADELPKSLSPSRQVGYQVGSLASSFAFTVVVGSEAPSPKLLRSLRGMLSEGGFFIIPRIGYRTNEIVYFTQNKDNPTAIFQTPVTSQLKSLPALPETLDSETRQELVAIRELTVRVFRPETPIERVEGGCERYCELNENFNLSNGLQATRTRVIAGGSLLKDWIRVWEDASHTAVRALAIFTPSGDFSHFYHFSKPDSTVRLTVGEAQPGVYRLLSVYGSQLEGLLSRSPILQPMTPDTRQNIKNGWQEFDQLQEDSAYEQPQVVVCESGFNQDLFLKVPSSHILHGPHSGSLFGWVGALQSNGDHPLYYSGVASRNEFGVSETIGDLSGHAQTVVYSLADPSGKLPLILPIGISQCLYSGSRWVPIVLEHSKARVVSLSSTDTYDSASCAKSPILKSIESASGKLLWVVAAGNDATNLDSDLRGLNDACPATLKRRDVLVVGSGSSSYLDHFSNYGTGTVDLVADGTSALDGEHRATSYAAPRAAAVAAEIVRKYPQVSSERVKQILVLSVELSPWNPLPVRSGGYLSRERALVLADYWAARPQASAREALEGAFGESTSTHWLIRFFNERGLLK